MFLTIGYACMHKVLPLISSKVLVEAHIHPRYKVHLFHLEEVKSNICRQSIQLAAGRFLNQSDIHSTLAPPGRE